MSASRAGDRPAQRGVQVVLLGREQAEPAHLIGGAQQRVGGLGQLAVVAGERVPGGGRPRPPPPAVPGRRRGPSRASGTGGRRRRTGSVIVRIDLPTRPESAVRTSARRSVPAGGWPGGPVAGGAGGRPARPRSGWRRRGRPPGGGRARARAPRAAASSSRRRAERLVPGQRGPAAAGEQREPVVEALGQLGRGQRAQPRRRELDRQRHAVEGPADLGDRRRRCRRRARSRAAPRRPGRRTAAPPEMTAIGRSDLRSRAPAVPGGAGGQRRHHVQASRRGSAAARGWSPATWTRGAVGQQPGGEDGGGVDHVLAVVEDQQRVPAREGRAEPVGRVGAAGPRRAGRSTARAGRARRGPRAAPRPGRSPGRARASQAGRWRVAPVSARPPRSPAGSCPRRPARSA